MKWLDSMGEWVLGAIGTAGAVLIWLVRLEGRVNAHDLRHEQADKSRDEMREDLTYIRERIDRAINGYGK